MDLTKIAQERGIKYFLVSFVDLFGVLRAKMVPAQAIGQMQADGAGFAAFAAWMDMTPADPDTLAFPDPESFIHLPWNRDVAWLASDLYMNGKIIESGPRAVLRRQIEAMNVLGYIPKTGVECEFHLINEDGTRVFDSRDTQEKPCYDQQAHMRRYPVISEICDAMIALRWGPYQNDHEDANGQFEMNWGYAPALITADRHVFFKYMVKTIAEKHQLRATFMPKPFANLTGNGCHAHVSLWDKKGRNLFCAKKPESDERGLGLSDLAYHFLAGVLKHTKELVAIFNPTVNSYKRIWSSTTSSGATWSPKTVTYSGNNRTHLIRVPEGNRFELRLADGAVNPYLLQAGMIAAGRDGIENKINPGNPRNENMYTNNVKVSPKDTLPENLFLALDLLKRSKFAREMFGDEFVSAYYKLSSKQWHQYAAHLSQWELDNTLDC